MRTTLSLDDDLAESLNRAARLTGRSFKAVVRRLSGKKSARGAELSAK